MHRVKRNIVWFIAIVIAIILVWLGATSDSTTTQVGRPTIKFGAAFSLTGSAASFAERIKPGIELAIEEINARDGGYVFEVIYEDTQSEATKAVNAVNKLVNIDDVRIILGPLRSGNVLAAAPVTEAAQVILMAPISSSPDITHAGDYVFRTRETSKLSGERMAEYVLGQGFSQVALLTAQGANSIAYRDSFEARFKELGRGIAVSIDYEPESTDFRSDIAKALAAGPDVFYISATTGVDAGLLTRQLRELGFEGQITGSNAFDSAEFFEGVGELAEGVIITSPAFDIESPDISDYREVFKERVGTDSGPYAANAYDAVMLLADAVVECGGDENTDCIRDYLYGVEDYPGVGGKTTFDENGDVIKPVALKIVKDGEFVFHLK